MKRAVSSSIPPTHLRRIWRLRVRIFLPRPLENESVNLPILLLDECLKWLCIDSLRLQVPALRFFERIVSHFSRSASALGDECKLRPLSCTVVDGLDMSVTADLVVLDVAPRLHSDVELPSDAKHLRARVYHTEADRRRELHLRGHGLEPYDEPSLRHQAQQATDAEALGAVPSLVSRHVVAACCTRSACSRRCARVRISCSTTRAGRRTVRFDWLTHL